jgi:2-keto-4-pentenoate hydratase
MLLQEPAVNLGAFMQARLEPELAAVLRADIPSGLPPGDIARAVPGLFLAVDILDTVWEAYESEPSEVVADGVNSGAFLLGEQMLPLNVSGELRLRVNGDIVSAGSVADMGDPVTRIGWLAAEVNGLRSGDVVFLGSPGVNVSATAGTLLLEGPDGSTLFAGLRGEA